MEEWRPVVADDLGDDGGDADELAVVTYEKCVDGDEPMTVQWMPVVTLLLTVCQNKHQSNNDNTVRHSLLVRGLRWYVDTDRDCGKFWQFLLMLSAGMTLELKRANSSNCAHWVWNYLRIIIRFALRSQNVITSLSSPGVNTLPVWMNT